MSRRTNRPEETSPARAELSPLQLAIMRVLWRRERATVSEVVEALRPDRTLAPTTVATTLARLEKRGVVDHDTEGRLFVYRPIVAEGEVRRSMVGALTEHLFAGDTAALLNHLLTERDVDPSELERLRAWIEERQQDEEDER